MRELTFHSLAPVGFPSWEHSEYWARAADTIGGAVKVAALRRSGGTLIEFVECSPAGSMLDAITKRIERHQDYHRRKRIARRRRERNPECKPQPRRITFEEAEQHLAILMARAVSLSIDERLAP